MEEQNKISTPVPPSAEEDLGKPPLFKTWRGMYLAVLILHALVIAVLYIFTLNYQ